MKWLQDLTSCRFQFHFQKYKSCHWCSFYKCLSGLCPYTYKSDATVWMEEGMLSSSTFLHLKALPTTGKWLLISIWTVVEPSVVFLTNGQYFPWYESESDIIQSSFWLSLLAKPINTNWTQIWQTSTLITLDIKNECGECHAKYFIVWVRLSHTLQFVDLGNTHVK